MIMKLNRMSTICVESDLYRMQWWWAELLPGSLFQAEKKVHERYLLKMSRSDMKDLYW